jgi:hypothetical protein
VILDQGVDRLDFSSKPELWTSFLVAEQRKETQDGFANE